MTRSKSLVNSIKVKRVRSQFGPHINVVDKYFAAAAVGTGIALPVERIKIEERVSNFVSSICQNYEFIRTPKLLDIDYNKSIIRYEHINAQTLGESIEHNNPPKNLIKELFRFLSDLTGIEMAQASELFSGLEDVSSQCEFAQLRYKFGDNIDFMGTSTRSLCLGDVSLSNILLRDNKLHLIDFEFARIFDRSYDSAQIFSQLNVFLPRVYGLELISEHLQGDSFTKWVNLFTSYYRRKVATDV